MFIEAVFKFADDEALSHLAAGPVEHLLGNHGDDYIDTVEQRAKGNPRFARMLGGCWQYTMSEDIWARVRAVRPIDK